MRVKYCYTWGYCHPVTCGADVVACNHLDYFRRKNWDVDCLLVKDGRKLQYKAEFRARYPWLKSVTLVDLPLAQFNLREQLFAYERAALNPPVREALARPADLFFTNYVFTTPLLAHLPPGCRKVLETVDVLTHQFEVAERHLGLPPTPLDRRRHEFLLRTELDLYRLYDAVVMINPEECEMVRSHSIGHAGYVPQAFVDETEAENPAGERHDYDLIFVGSDAPINVNGITWFYRNVYVPYLWRHGVRLLLVGGAARFVDFPDVHVTRIPEVLGPLSHLYAASRIAIAPIFDGTGLSIKTLEALSHGCATVLSPVGARGLDDQSGAYVKLDMKSDPRRTAEVILGLLHNPEQRRQLEAAALAYVRRCFSRAAYTRAMDQLLFPAA